jgi:polysaccharide biosynthesis/export protein
MATAFFVAGCGGANFQPETATAVTPTASLGAPSAGDLVRMEATPSLIGPGDRLEFKVLGLSELDRTVRVDGAGRIALPLVGEIQAGGRQVNVVRSEVQTMLGSRYLQNPQVTLELIESLTQRFVIDGGVRTPGIYPVLSNQTLMQSVAQAQGATDTARLSEVVIFRSIDGVPHAARFDLAAIRGGRAPDPMVYPNDRIVVGNDSTRAILREVLALSPFVGAFVQIAQ